MPTIVRAFGLRLVIYPNDHEPIHVHVVAPDWEAVVNLSGSELCELIGGNERDARRALALVNEHMAVLLAAWRTIHG